ncbi:predicted protein [Mycolicibacterium canariasense]|uniref:Uncharacterized protein n=1 Tax=Mycolicibacterium canariasense TaxID=228230 RepID=A0A100WJ62_MYCCR|nr:hypothetical protein [Mycolicibacterium canariasense]MCV7210151.1 hypothetical protein [Mycolicibacterium canariasense]ORU97857.1 hypothetical protein AWB94_29325 [Mycolicibacterium canariasense]GAS98798.1 predicted protein [Mycolicibacterium canariasense]
MSKQRLRIVAVLEVDADHYPPGDAQSQSWLVNNILLGGGDDFLILHSNEIGDELGSLNVECVVSAGQGIAMDESTEIQIALAIANSNLAGQKWSWRELSYRTQLIHRRKARAAVQALLP